MAAPSADRPVTVTLGATVRLQIEPPPPRPPRLSVAVTVQLAVLIAARVFFGAVYLNDCPQQPNIPSYLLGLALLQLIMIPYVVLPCERDAGQLKEYPRGFQHFLLCVTSLYIYALIVAGDVWVFSVYQPNYDAAAADGLYCDRSLYTFAFWNAVWETIGVAVGLARSCAGLLCWVVMSPAPANANVRMSV